MKSPLHWASAKIPFFIENNKYAIIFLDYFVDKYRLIYKMEHSLETTKNFDFHKIKKGIVIYAILGVAVFAVIGMYADFGDLVESVGRFNFAYLPLILLLA